MILLSLFRSLIVFGWCALLEMKREVYIVTPPTLSPHSFPCQKTSLEYLCMFPLLLLLFLLGTGMRRIILHPHIVTVCSHICQSKICML